MFGFVFFLNMRHSGRSEYKVSKRKRQELTAYGSARSLPSFVLMRSMRTPWRVLRMRGARSDEENSHFARLDFELCRTLLRPQRSRSRWRR